MHGPFLAEWSSLQRRALRNAFALCVAMMFGTMLILVADEITDEAIFDQQLDHIAKALASSVHNDGPAADGAPMRVLTLRPASDALLYQIWLRDGTLLHHSQQSPTSVPLVAFSHHGFSTVEIQSQRYRVYSATSADGDSLVQVAEQIGEQDHFRMAMLLTYLVSLLLPLWLTWRITNQFVKRSMRLLNALAARVEEQDPHDAAPLRLDEDAPEILPLLNSVNGLVQRAAGVISLEQRFTSVAAHELRAPLAGIRVQAQLAERAESEQELHEALGLLLSGVDRAARVFDQLLDLTRMEGLMGEHDAHFDQVDLQAVCRRVIDELRPLLRRKRIEYVETIQAQWLEGAEFAVYLILRNLTANAILYSPEQGRVEVSSELRQKCLVLRVDDSGKGIAETDRRRVFERYCRLHQSGNEGIGLGLFIVQQAVQLHHASIELLDSPQGGLRVQVTFAARPRVAYEEN